MGEAERERYQPLMRAVWLAARVVVVLWLLYVITPVLFIFLFALIIAMALNPPVTWLADRKVPRFVGAALVFLAIGLVAGLMGWLILPKLAEQLQILLEAIPGYVAALVDRVADQLAVIPEFEQRVRVEGVSLDSQLLGRLLPSIQAALSRVGSYSITLFAFIVFVLSVLGMVVYMLVDPRPLLAGFIHALPEDKRAPAERAFQGSTRMVAGWVWSNVIVGAVEAVIITVALTLLGVPGALLWGILAFIAELVPKIGLYLMAIPPILVALAIDPWKALWVLVFFMVMNELLGDFVWPIVRGSTMNLHPVVLIFAVLALGAAFGAPGVLIATPLTGILAAFYHEFYAASQPDDPELEQRITRMLGAD